MLSSRKGKISAFFSSVKAEHRNRQQHGAEQNRLLKHADWVSALSQARIRKTNFQDSHLWNWVTYKKLERWRNIATYQVQHTRGFFTHLVKELSKKNGALWCELVFVGAGGDLERKRLHSEALTLEQGLQLTGGSVLSLTGGRGSSDEVWTHADYVSPYRYRQQQ